jgi:hypothetical protein
MKEMMTIMTVMMKQLCLSLAEAEGNISYLALV